MTAGTCPYCHHTVTQCLCFAKTNQIDPYDRDHDGDELASR